VVLELVLAPGDMHRTICATAATPVHRARGQLYLPLRLKKVTLDHPFRQSRAAAAASGTWLRPESENPAYNKYKTRDEIRESEQRRWWAIVNPGAPQLHAAT
jgi:hypothetical protein